MKGTIVLILLSLMCVPLAVGQNVSFYQTTSDLSQKLQPQTALTFGDSGNASQTITVDATKTYQQVDGFGASFTDSSAWLVYTKLTTDQRTDLMTKLFDRTDGIALSFIRQPMGASDLALNFYSYDDMPAGQTDPNLDNFSIDHDRAYIVPVLKQALSLNPNIKFMANPWSPPAWMKTNNSLLGTYNGQAGYLKPEAFDPLAKYFVKYIQAYQAEGIPTHYISMQNEPQYAPTGYTGMMMSPQDQINLLTNNIDPAFRAAGIKTKVMVWDHNWDNTNYAVTILKDSKASAIAAGSAWHHYAGLPSAMTTVHDQFPDKDIWETEASGGTWGGGEAFPNLPKELINTMRNWAKSYVLWNMVLDQNRGPVAKTPTGDHGCDTCRGLMTVTWQDGSASAFKAEADYYVLGHASKFLQPGAYRIDSTQLAPNSVLDVAFRNPDGSIVLYAFNPSGSDQTFNVKFGAKYFTTTIKAGAIATYVWSSSAAPAVAVEQQPNGIVVPSGQTGTVTLTVTPLADKPSVTLGCQVVDSTGAAVSAYSCSATQTNFTFTDANPITTTVTFRSAGSAAVTHGRSYRGAALLAAFGAMPLAGLVLTGGRKRRATVAVLSLIVVAGVLVSCGGGGGNSGGGNPPPVTQVAAAPVFTPAAGTYSGSQVVSITSSTPGATIYYTADGSAPTSSSTKYTAPLTVSSNQTLKAIATAAGYTNSSVSTAAYTINVATNVSMVITATTDTGAPVVVTVPVLVK